MTAGSVMRIRAGWRLEPTVGVLSLAVLGGWAARDRGELPGDAAVALGLLLLLTVGAASFISGRRHRLRAARGPDAELQAGDVLGIGLLLVAFGGVSWADGPLGAGRLAWPLFGAISVAYARWLYRAVGQGIDPSVSRGRVTRRRSPQPMSARTWAAER